MKIEQIIFPRYETNILSTLSIICWIYLDVLPNDGDTSNAEVTDSLKSCRRQVDISVNATGATVDNGHVDRPGSTFSERKLIFCK